jgi:hypothetical protein
MIPVAIRTLNRKIPCEGPFNELLSRAVKRFALFHLDAIVFCPNLVLRLSI